MFTGLVQSLGSLNYYDRHHLSIQAPDLIDQIHIGDSIAVNGVCLTATQIHSTSFTADISPETLRRTNLGNSLHLPVNLELALRPSDRLGGHFVTGHIDGVGSLVASNLAGESWLLEFSAPAKIAKYIITKGSIAINGVSLTIANCNHTGSWFSAAVIPHTYSQTNLQHLLPSAPVNLEADLLGKYVEKFLRSPQIPTPMSLTQEFLTEHGWVD
ncbi:MAG: riboflavin synthase [Pseudanabaenaceae cyanobacterium bins.68]|nr:riboflavin synthase [Pseudanabaenaceae cyanobacterium bins.68]